MKIGICGLGIVGECTKYCFEMLGHEVLVHDIRLDTKLSDLLPTECIYVAVPTPSNEDGSANVEIVSEVVEGIIALGYVGIIAIKSTCPIGYTQSLIDKYPNNKICFQPEFIKEHMSYFDATEGMDILVVGTDSDEIFNTIVRHYGKYPKSTHKLPSASAELLKHYNNAYAGTLVVLANSFWEVANRKGLDYQQIKSVLVNRKHIYDQYLDVYEPRLRGFSGPCIAKDLKEMKNFCQREELKVGFFADVLKENDLYIPTVLPGMRDK